MIESARERIYQTIVDYCNTTHQPISRKRLVQLTGYKFTIVDEHVKHLKDIDAKIQADAPGFFQPVRTFPRDRAQTVSVLPDGLVKWEIGEHLIDLTPHEWMVLGSLAAGAARNLAELTAEKAMQAQITRLEARAREQAKAMAHLADQLTRWRRTGQPDLFDTRQPKETT